MLIGGTEKGIELRTHSDGTYKQNAFGYPDYSQVKWNDRFVLWGTGTNLACGKYSSRT